jgi:hypothetical protein
LLAVIVLLLTMMFPPAPEVPETRLNRDPDESVSTAAVMPTEEALIVEASPASVLFEEFSVMVSAVPLPACSVIEPESVLEELGISDKYPLDVAARLLTVTVCVPATAEALAAVSDSTLLSELAPSFVAITPVVLVRLLMSLESVDNSVPRLEIAVSWLSNVVN